MKIVIYYPSLNKNGMQLDGIHIQDTVRTLCTMFGGCTVTNGIGYWPDDNGTMIIESVNLLHIGLPVRLWIKYRRQLKSMIMDLKTTLNQSSMFYEVNDRPYYL